MSARLATMVQRAQDVHINNVLNLVMVFCAFVLGTSLYAVTRDEDQDIALLGMVCRMAEGVSGAVFIAMTLGLLELARTAGANGVDAIGGGRALVSRQRRRAASARGE